jgi:hypothetical protein
MKRYQKLGDVGNTVVMVHKNGTNYCGCKDNYAKQ